MNPTNELKPLLSEDGLSNMIVNLNGRHFTKIKRHGPAAELARDVRNLYAAHLAERDALIQRVVDYWDKWQGKGCIEADMEFDDIVTDMNKAGFKSTSSSDELRNPE